ncbi:amastin-like protein [Leishmania guyanensis]|uniref:Putative amastin-like protein n=1 Tax=Leishmania guyanensis TaxID=5670 RepID=A0A1E1IWR6_LEIGU|nr:Putative amastin-like protein [Leishmania guyanensis]
MGCISGFLFGILQFVAILFITVGTPLAMYVPRSENAKRVTNGYCITMWGIRDKCLTLTYSEKTADVWSECPGRVSRFKAAQVFAIGAAIILIASILANLLNACCCYCVKYLCIVLNLVAAVVLSISWGCILDCYLRNQGSFMRGTVDVCMRIRDFPGLDNSHPDGMQLGVGFILLVFACVISFVNIFVTFLPC